MALSYPIGNNYSAFVGLEYQRLNSKLTDVVGYMQLLQTSMFHFLETPLAHLVYTDNGLAKLVLMQFRLLNSRSLN